MSIDISLALSRPGFTLEACFRSDARLIALFGASGSGKSTLVNMIAGLVRPDAGYIKIDDRVLYDGAKGLFLPPHQRQIGYVFQEARLFPHLKVRQNLTYGRWFSAKTAAYADFSRLVELLGLETLLDKMPAQLSGGEQQRVAIGRAILSSPRLLLMDEPLSSLDEPRKQEILPYIERLRDELHIPILYVSHSLSEVGRLAEDMVVLAHGKMVAHGPTAAIMQQLDLISPEDRQEGSSLIDMVIVDYDPAFDITKLAGEAGITYVTGQHGARNERRRIRLRARDIMLALSQPQDISALNCFKGRIIALERHEAGVLRVKIAAPGLSLVAQITQLSGAQLKLQEGQEVYAIAKSVSLEHDHF